MTHITQSSIWTKFKEKTGLKVVKTKSGYVYFSRLKYLPFSFGYLPRPNKVDVEELKKIGQEEKAIAVKIEPDLNCVLPKDKDLRLSKSILPQHTLVLNLKQSCEKILEKMHSKTRYNIRLAQKNEVKITTGNNSEDIHNFCELLKITTKHKGFREKNCDYFQLMWQILRPTNNCHLLLAKTKNGDFAGGLWLLSDKDTLYYRAGGSDDQYRQVMANDLLHFEAIKLGQSRGLKFYDFWGAYKEKPEENDPWWGIYRFKNGFGGQLIDYPETKDLILKPCFYQFYLWLF